MKLATKRLILRDVKINDAKSIVENVNTLQVSKYLAQVPYPCTLKAEKEFLKLCMKRARKKKREFYNFGVELKSKKGVIGMITLIDVNRFVGTAEIGYWLGKKYWRQGLMSEALTRVIDFAFKKLKLRRINISAFKENKASNSLIKKFGFKYEGLRKKFDRSKATGKVHDKYEYGMLKEEWK